MGYQLNDGTHVHANRPFADHKLIWKAAILVQQRTAGKGTLIEGMMEGQKRRGGKTEGFCLHPNHDHLGLARYDPKSFCPG